MSLFGKLLKITDRLPMSRPFAALAKRYADRYEGEEIDNGTVNGEHWLASKVLPRCKTVFDCGANIGSWTQSALQINSNLTIHCFEPVEKNFRELCSRNPNGNAVKNQLGVGAEPGEIEIHLFESGACNSIYNRSLAAPSGGQVTERIRLTTVDLYCAENAIAHIDFLKLDVEGHEIAAMKGMRESLAAQRIEMMQFEYGGTYLDAGTRLKDVFDWMAPFSYDFYKLRGSGLRKIPVYEVTMDNFRYQNWLLVRRGSNLLA